MSRPAAEHDLAAVRALARELGLGSVEPFVLRLARHTVVRLGKLPLVARVQSAGDLDQACEAMARELRVARHLTALGAPVVPPSMDPPPGVHRVDGCAISLWSYVEHRPADERNDGAAAGAALKEVHYGLASFDGALPSLASAIDGCRALLNDPAALRAMPPVDRAALRDCFLRADAAAGWRDEPLIPLHGDTHFGNLFMTPAGPLWGDLEAVCTGPLEWDLVDKPAAMLAAFGEIDRPLLDRLAVLRLACVVTWCWADVDRSPQMRDAAEHHFARLRARQ